MLREFVVHTRVIAPEGADTDDGYRSDSRERQIILLMIESADCESGKLATRLPVRDATKLLCARPFKQGDLPAMIRSVLHRAVQHEQQVVILVGKRLVQPGFRER